MSETEKRVDERVVRLNGVKTEAERFIKNCDAAINRIEKDSSYYAPVATKEFAAAKRSSLDLTRILAEFRKPS